MNLTYWENLWSAIRGGTGTSRNAGIQYETPAAYAIESAVPVTEDTALQVSAVWACVRLLAETVASLPVHVYRKLPNGRVSDKEHWLARMAARKMNRYQTRVEFFETMMLNLALHGNAYARIERIGGKIRSLMPLMASQMEVTLLNDGSIIYTYTEDGRVSVYAEKSIWHVRLNGNGIIGKSPLAFARNIIGVAQAAEQTVTSVYQNGGKRSGVLSVDKLLTKEQRAAIRENFATLTTGDDARLLVLEMGMKFDAISMSPQDIELLASRKFQLEEICRWFGVPSVLVNDTSGGTTWGSGIEQLVTGFYKLNLRPYLERIEASSKRWLLPNENAYLEFEFEGLLRSDLKTRLEGYRTGIAGSIMTPNEARLIEGWPSKPGGDDLLSQVNMSPITKLGQTGAQNAPQTTDNL